MPFVCRKLKYVHCPTPPAIQYQDTPHTHDREVGGVGGS